MESAKDIIERSKGEQNRKRYKHTKLDSSWFSICPGNDLIFCSLSYKRWNGISKKGLISPSRHAS